MKRMITPATPIDHEVVKHSTPSLAQDYLILKGGKLALLCCHSGSILLCHTCCALPVCPPELSFPAGLSLPSASCMAAALYLLWF